MPKRDAHLIEALTKAYTTRALIFHRGVSLAKVDLLIAEIDDIDSASLSWTLADLAISRKAFNRVQKAGGLPHQVFAHPSVISLRPHLIAYYRNIVTISKKGIGQILFPSEAYEAGKKRSISPDQAVQICRTFNRIISGVIEEIPKYKVQLSRQAILAEIGTELQGTWANLIGQGAAKVVEDIFAEYIQKNALGEHPRKGFFALRNGWTIVFGSEPDVAFMDAEGLKQIAIEIKGSLDTAGAQTRYGEAKKSFAKQIKENPRCHTIYLASCFTDAVIEQIKSDGEVRDWINLTSVIGDQDERQQFLERLFHVVHTPIKHRRK
jgi:hypothetical protein